MTERHVLEKIRSAGNLLDLSDSGLTVIPPEVLTLKKLEVLDLCNNRIKDVAPLKELKGLKALYLASNQITDVKPLAGLENLNWLRLDDNQITDVKPLGGLEKNGTKIYV